MLEKTDGKILGYSKQESAVLQCREVHNTLRYFKSLFCFCQSTLFFLSFFHKGFNHSMKFFSHFSLNHPKRSDALCTTSLFFTNLLRIHHQMNDHRQIQIQTTNCVNAFDCFLLLHVSLVLSVFIFLLAFFSLLSLVYYAQHV